MKNDRISITILRDDGTFPNNSRLPMLHYRGVLVLPDKGAAEEVERVFSTNGWGNMWRNGIYDVHHYHSTAHEALGVYAGWARVQLGGPNGVEVRIEEGDVVVIPAGVAHKNLGQSGDFRVVGAYPRGQRWDMNYGNKGERPAADNNIAEVALPDTDPVFGEDGPLVAKWHNR